MKKRTKFICLLLAVSIMVITYIFLTLEKKKNQSVEINYHKLQVIEAVESIHRLYDVENYIQLKKLKIGKEEELNKTALKRLLNQLQITQSQKEELLQLPKEEKITREEWSSILLSLGEWIGIGNVCKSLETAVFYQSEKEEALVTNHGHFGCKSQTELQDKKIRAIIREQEIVFVIDVINQVDFQNVLLKDIDKHSVTGMLFGQERTFRLLKELQYTEELSKYTLGDMILDNGELQELHFKQAVIQGKIQSVSEEGIELEGYGRLPVSDYVRFFQSETLEAKQLDSLVVGNETTTFIVGKGQICGAFIEEEQGIVSNPNIRVMLMTTGFQDFLHDVVTITCKGDFHLYFYEKGEGDGIENRTEVLHPYQAGATLALTAENDILSYSRIRIVPVQKNDKLQITSFKRNGNYPEYRGSIEVSVYDGKLVLVNEVSIEEYLYSVVPSEMPSSYGVEALKVQAVCARSYAVSHMKASQLSKYGAHVDDSVNYQVYNNTPETENSIAATDATKGMVMTYDNAVIHAYFYATCCGSTADGTVWGNQQIPYIQSKYLGTGAAPDLMNNEVFTKFIKGTPESYDDESPWYRWKVTLSMETLTNCINHKLYSLYCANKNQVLTLGANGKFESKPIHSVGAVKSVSVTRRGRGGIIEELLIKGTEAEVLILKQGNVRKIINPYGNEMIRKDGSVTDTMSALPSAFFAIEKGKDGNSLEFYGGGYGHGAGMSQTAVKEMIQAGMGYEEILKFFYPGTLLEAQSG